MRETPIVDEEIKLWENIIKTSEGWHFKYRMMTKCAEKLETELAQAKDKLAEAINTIHDLWDKCGCDHPACKQCQRDKRTEQFLERNK